MMMMMMMMMTMMTMKMKKWGRHDLPKKPPLSPGRDHRSGGRTRRQHSASCERQLHQSLWRWLQLLLHLRQQMVPFLRSHSVPLRPHCLISVLLLKGSWLHLASS
jgi:hypothetical protein